MKVFKKANKLKGSKKLKDIGISPDETLKQLEQDKRLQQERDRKKDEGENILFRGEIVRRSSLDQTLRKIAVVDTGTPSESQ